MTAPSQLEPIPQPPGVILFHNMFDLDASHPLESMSKLAREYGPIYQLEVPGGGRRIVVSGYSLVNELCDDTHFDKQIGPGLRSLNDNLDGGLFTSRTDDPRWHRAHNILLPAFSLDEMRRYLPMMLDLATQLMLKWARLNPGDSVDVPGDMTRLTLDTIGLCGFDYRFNSFYSETPHPFVAAMVRVLATAQQRSRQLPLRRKLSRKVDRQNAEDEAYMSEFVGQIIQERRKQGAAGAGNDLLGRMLTGVDPQTGQQLDDQNIIAQCITFLVAGHETTSGLLSFAIYLLLKHPAVLAKAYAEVDRVLGTDLEVLPTYAQAHQLDYVTQILNETLRLYPTAPAFTRAPLQDAVLGGKYALAKGEAATILIGMLHRDPSVWGEHAEDFDPEHFSAEAMAKIPPNAYKPFGTGQRACIGRQFAMQEAILVLGMLLQRFEFVDAYNYQLETQQTLTIKPHNFHIQVRSRPGRTGSAVAVAVPAAAAPAPAAPPAMPAIPAADRHNTPLLVLYGSNLGTASGIAQTIAQDGASRGFAASVGTLDEHAGKLPTSGAVVIVTASYNGTPPDNAAKFCTWLREPSLAADACKGVHYTVFGCGNRDWASTYQAIPTLVDTQLAAHGAERLYARGEGDARGDFDGQYRAWYGGLWPALATALKLPASVGQAPAAGPRLSVAFVNRQTTSPIVTTYQAVTMKVGARRELQRHDGERPSERSTLDIEVALPAGVSYRAGDHLGVVPRNGLETLQRVLRHFQLDAGLYLTITPTANVSTPLPTGEPVPLVGVLANRVELQDTATRAQIATLAEHTADQAQQDALLALAGDDEASLARYHDGVLVQHKSVLDLLEEFPACALPFAVYLDMLPPLRPRYYSISSSPLAQPTACSITVGVLDAPARRGQGVFKGVCSNYLSLRAPADEVFAFVHAPTLPFQPPANPHQPMIMVGPGTGVAPFRGFLQERAALKQQGVPVGESLLFFGCRDPLQDFIYEDELRAWEAAGVTKLFTAFSRVPGQPKTYVQQVIKEQASEVWRLLQQEAVVFICGDASRMAPDVRRAFADVFLAQTSGATEADAQAWLAGLVATQRYLEDIWAGGAG